MVRILAFVVLLVASFAAGFFLCPSPESPAPEYVVFDDQGKSWRFEFEVPDDWQVFDTAEPESRSDTLLLHWISESAVHDYMVIAGTPLPIPGPSDSRPFDRAVYAMTLQLHDEESDYWSARDSKGRRVGWCTPREVEPGVWRKNYLKVVEDQFFLIGVILGKERKILEAAIRREFDPEFEGKPLDPEPAFAAIHSSMVEVEIVDPP